MIFKIIILCVFVTGSFAQRGSYASGHRPVAAAAAQPSAPSQTQSNFAAPSQAAPNRVDVSPTNNYASAQQQPSAFGGGFGHQGFQPQSFGGGLGVQQGFGPQGFYPNQGYPFGFNGR